MLAIRTATIVFAIGASVAGARTAHAQLRGSSQLPRVGDRVRVVAPSIRDDRYVGQVESLPRDSITLDTAGVRRRLGFDLGPVLVEEYRRVTIPTSAIQSIDISTGRTHRRSTVKGMIFGALGGAALFGATNLPEVNPTFADFVDGAAVGVLVGGVAGGVVGYLLGGEKWTSFYRAGVLPP
ncbi:MAG TPA: hypothetical protein VM076_24575 [Gemmatimonadaceae bacterium]|nr:hypothetical protein [Gemmatimonadaceae bacterium]